MPNVPLPCELRFSARLLNGLVTLTFPRSKFTRLEKKREANVTVRLSGMFIENFC